ncbi:stage V sporulation protein AE [Clostridium swellfunianum]|uniref:stage V sporulation protein AE n=1 Tax=Clostridium swellfunianum TaxID=1367462 RepID=UPI00202EE157|nr:stage V sporulation protein AE [Clostridium swellfunianum]MCM0650560.1 stage V sporulation protein AE [Clostridium swellfunianum]
MLLRRRVIIVTDGDDIAKKAVEEAARNIGGRCISMSAGNPTVLSGEKIIELIKMAKYDPVVVMVDDRGDIGMGWGEKAMSKIMKDEEIEVLGIIAVASNTARAKGVTVDCSIDKYGTKVYKAVDKYGNVKNNRVLKGDTVNMLSNSDVKYIVGIGDPGKMDGKDNIIIGAPIITKAMEQILENYNKELTDFS